MKRAAFVLLCVAVFGLSTWAVGAQSTIVAPHVREVNSELIHALTTSINNLLTTINANIAVDATHDSAAAATGPQGMGECDDTSTDAVDEGDAGRVRIDCTTRAQFTRLVDPCSGAKTHIPVSIVTATTTELTPTLAGASTHYYICSVNLVTAGANNVLIADDDSDGCGSPSNGIFGSDASPAAGEGWNFAANGIFSLGNGIGTVGKTNGANRVICAITSAAVQLSGSITVVAAP